MADLGALIEARMKENGFQSYTDLSNYSGLTKSMISKYKLNQSKPEYNNMKILARALNIPYIEMIKEVGGYENIDLYRKIAEEQQIDDEVHQLLLDICREIYYKNTALRSLFLNFIKEKFDEHFCRYITELIEIDEDWFKHIETQYGFNEGDRIHAFTYRGNKIALRVLSRLIHYNIKYDWIREFKDSLVHISKYSPSENQSISEQSKVEITDKSYRLFFKGVELTDLEYSRMIHMMKFERDYRGEIQSF
ncbi:hypothetical protein YSY43_39290 [Paenibacillus sp. YSY-4.3]